jgi:hypothetical protein
MLRALVFGILKKSWHQQQSTELVKSFSTYGILRVFGQN